jgi:exonuclease SbcD
MIKVVHSSDLHLTSGEDRQYGLEVLRELVGQANAKEAGFLLFCGDLFDSFDDLRRGPLVNSVRQELELLRAGCRALYIPGNHEELGRGPEDKLSNYDFGRLELALDPASPFGGKLVQVPGAEFVCVPHAADYAAYREWKLPPKKPGCARVVLLHGTSSAVYRGPDPEEKGAGVIPDALFSWLRADYAALGHVHAARETEEGGCAVVYPGSARVWRRAEAGPRKAVYFEIEEGKIGPRQDLALSSAGEYRCFTLPLDPDATVPGAELEALLEKCSRPYKDYIAVRFSGLVEDANAFAAMKKTVESLVLAKSPRRFEILPDEVQTYGGLAGNELAKEFLEKLDARKPPEGSPEQARWLAARRQGLAVLAGELE